MPAAERDTDLLRLTYERTERMPKRLPSADDRREAARLLRALLDALPSRGGRDEATRHRVHGAALALDAASGEPPPDAD